MMFETAIMNERGARRHSRMVTRVCARTSEWSSWRIKHGYKKNLAVYISENSKNALVDDVCT